MMYGFSPFMIITSTLGGPRRFYGGIYTVEKYIQGVYFSTWVAT
jgi:hypothetical protein